MKVSSFYVNVQFNYIIIHIAIFLSWKVNKFQASIACFIYGFTLKYAIKFRIKSSIPSCVLIQLQWILSQFFLFLFFFADSSMITIACSFLGINVTKCHILTLFFHDLYGMDSLNCSGVVFLFDVARTFLAVIVYYFFMYFMYDFFV